MPVYNRLELTINCINSIKRQTLANYQIIICDHGNDGTYEVLKNKFTDIVLLKGNESMWWTAATNKCVEYALKHGKNDDYVFTLNNDTELDEDCLNVLVQSANNYPNSIIGCVNLLFDQKNNIEPSAQKKTTILGLDFYRSVNRFGDELTDYEGIIRVNALSGKGVLIPIPIFKKIGLYNEVMLPHYHADTEFTIRASKAGYNIFLNYSAKLYSHYKETGLTARSSKKTLHEFIYGFFSIKSTRHYLSLKNRAKLIYGKSYPIYFFINLLGVTMGFLKRLFYSFLKKK